MARRVVEEEEALCISTSEPLENIHRAVYLGKQVISREPAVPIFSSPKEYSGFTVQK
jgi:hypothetical protein